MFYLSCGSYFFFIHVSPALLHLQNAESAVSICPRQGFSDGVHEWDIQISAERGYDNREGVTLGVITRTSRLSEHPYNSGASAYYARNGGGLQCRLVTAEGVREAETAATTPIGAGHTVRVTLDFQEMTVSFYNVSVDEAIGSMELEQGGSLPTYPAGDSALTLHPFVCFDYDSCARLVRTARLDAPPQSDEEEEPELSALRARPPFSDQTVEDTNNLAGGVLAGAGWAETDELEVFLDFTAAFSDDWTPEMDAQLLLYAQARAKEKGLQLGALEARDLFALSRPPTAAAAPAEAAPRASEQLRALTTVAVAPRALSDEPPAMVPDEDEEDEEDGEDGEDGEDDDDEDNGALSTLRRTSSLRPQFSAQDTQQQRREQSIDAATARLRTISEDGNAQVHKDLAVVLLLFT